MTTMEMLEKLKTYQEILSERVALEEEIDILPKTIEAQNEMLSRLKKSFGDKDDAFKKSERKGSRASPRPAGSRDDARKGRTANGWNNHPARIRSH